MGNLSERVDRLCIFKSDIYDKEHVSTSIHVPVECYNGNSKENIEQELARRIGEELLNRELLYFHDSWKADTYGDVRVYCQISVLKHKDRTGIMPSRLKEVRNVYSKEKK